MSTHRKRKQFFSGTTLGIITATGTLIGGLGALTVALFGEGILGQGDSGPDPVGASVEELVRATVQIQAVNGAGQTVWWGSGSVIHEDGHILTAGHVVDDRLGEFDRLEVGITDDISAPPEWKYLAKTAAVDYALDLAILRIDSDLSGAAVAQLNLPFVAVGDSNGLRILDEVRILGYPSTGGETLTATSGRVSGFVAERGIGDRAWIKTEAIVGKGTSGGMAVNDAGELVGVPLILGSGSEAADFVDCEKVLDTNEDGLLDDADICVPVGSVFNGLRPVSLAEPLIQAAESGANYESKLPEPEPIPDLSLGLAEVLFTNLSFSGDGLAAKRPDQTLQSLPSGVTNICGSWQYVGMADRRRWDVVWYIDGERSKNHTALSQEWTEGEHGTQSVCIENQNGVADGLYELLVSVEGLLQVSEVVFVGPPTPVTFTVLNHSSQTICSVYISPSDAYDWGQERLGEDRVLESGEEIVFSMPSGSYDVSLDDCDGEVLAARYDLDAAEGFAITFGEPESR